MTVGEPEACAVMRYRYTLVILLLAVALYLSWWYFATNGWDISTRGCAHEASRCVIARRRISVHGAMSGPMFVFKIMGFLGLVSMLAFGAVRSSASESSLYRLFASGLVVPTLFAGFELLVGLFLVLLLVLSDDPTFLALGFVVVYAVPGMVSSSPESYRRAPKRAGPG